MQKERKTAILLSSIGSPEGPQIIHTFRYLSTFLGNKRVIGIPWIIRKILVNTIIIPFRIIRSAKEYKKLWEINGKCFPILKYTEFMAEELKKDNLEAFVGMAYCKPFIKQAVKKIIEGKYAKMILIPLFPQYASSTSGVIIEAVLKELSKYPIVPELKVINSFYKNELFAEAFAEKINRYDYRNYDHILFSFHSLPVTQIREASGTCYDYETECYETAALIAKKLDINEDNYSVSFQSSMGKNWQRPFTKDIIEEKALKGTKSIMIVSPSFVSDCLETTIELGEKYKNLFMNKGGEKYQLVEGLNESALWVKLIKSISLI